ncbi:10641_t:CDS:2, partial [Gigaspora rosea]
MGQCKQYNYSKLLPNTNEPDMDTVDQPAEGDILLENNEIKEIVAKLPDKSLYAPETAQAITTYLQIIDESVSTEEILNDKEITSMIQADENKESIRQEIDEDEVPDPPVTATEVFNAMQTVITMKNRKFQSSHFYDSHSQDTYPQDLYFQDSYSQDPYSQDSYSQDSYSQSPHFQDSDLQEPDSQESDSQESDSQELYPQDSYSQDS